MNWKTKVILFYSLGGLALGILAGITTIKNAVDNDKELDLTLKDGAKVGLAAMEVMKKTIIK